MLILDKKLRILSRYKTLFRQTIIQILSKVENLDVLVLKQL